MSMTAHDHHLLTVEHMRRECDCYAVTYDLEARPDGLWLTVSSEGKHAHINIMAKHHGGGVIDAALRTAWNNMPKRELPPKEDPRER